MVCGHFQFDGSACYFLGRCNSIPLWRWISHSSGCQAQALLQCAARNGTASTSAALLLQASVRGRASSRVPHFAWLLVICQAHSLASSIGAAPSTLACPYVPGREKPRDGGACTHHGDGQGVPHSEGCCAARVPCCVRGAQEERLLWIWFLNFVFFVHIFFPKMGPSIRCQDGPHLAKMGPIRGPSSERCSSKFIVSARRTCGIPPRPTLSYLGILPLLYPSRKEGETRNGKDRGTRGTRKRLRPASGR